MKNSAKEKLSAAIREVGNECLQGLKKDWPRLLAFAGFVALIMALLQ